MRILKLEKKGVKGSHVHNAEIISAKVDEIIEALSLDTNSVAQSILEFQTTGTTTAVYNFPFNDGDILNYKITGTNKAAASEYIFDRGFSPLFDGVTTIFDNSTESAGDGGQTISLAVSGRIMTVTLTGVAAQTWNWVFEYKFSRF